MLHVGRIKKWLRRWLWSWLRSCLLFGDIWLQRLLAWLRERRLLWRKRGLLWLHVLRGLLTRVERCGLLLRWAKRRYGLLLRLHVLVRLVIKRLQHLRLHLGRCLHRLWLWR